MKSGQTVRSFFIPEMFEHIKNRFPFPKEKVEKNFWAASSV